MKTLCITNQKGGTGKTTIAVLFAFYLQEQGKNVLFIDLDSQGNASKTLSDYQIDRLVASSLFDEEPILPVSTNKGITVITGDSGLAEVDRGENILVKQFAQNFSLWAESGLFDYCIMDNAPSLSLKMTTALIVADSVLTPIELEEYSFDGLEKVIHTIQNVKTQYNPILSFVGMLPNRVKGNSPRQKDTLAELEKLYKDSILPYAIPDRQCIPEAISMRIPVWKLRKTTARPTGQLLKQIFAALTERIAA